MVGRCIPYKNSPFLGAMLVSGRVSEMPPPSEFPALFGLGHGESLGATYYLAEPLSSSSWDPPLPPPENDPPVN